MQIQIPLQPLADNLDSATYEVFERDPFKYRQYGKAVEAALIDIVTKLVVHIIFTIHDDHNGFLCTNDIMNVFRRKEADLSSECVRVNVMVLGAGRGPLVIYSSALIIVTLIESQKIII